MAFHIEGVAKINHGICVGTLLHYTMEFNLPACKNRFSVLAKVMCGTDGKSSDAKSATGAIAAVKRLYMDLDFPRKFEEGLFDQSRLPEMTDSIMNGIEGLTGRKREYPLTAVLNCPNIRKATKQDVIMLYQKTFEGWTY